MIPFITTRTEPSALDVRVGVRGGHAAVGGPAGVADARRWRRCRSFPPAAVAQLGEVADRAHRLDDAVALVEEREPGRVVPAVLQALEAGEDELTAGAPADVPDDPAHVGLLPSRWLRRCVGRRGYSPAQFSPPRPRRSSRTTGRTHSAVGASTMTRTSGSVPEARTTTRPSSPSSASASRHRLPQRRRARAGRPCARPARSPAAAAGAASTAAGRRRASRRAPRSAASRCSAGREAVARGAVEQVDDVAALLAAEDVAAAGASPPARSGRRRRSSAPRCPRRPSRAGSRGWSSWSCTTASPASSPRGAARARRAPGSGRRRRRRRRRPPPARGRRRRRRPGPGRRRPRGRPPRAAPRSVEPQPVVDVHAVRLDADRRHPRAEPHQHLGRGDGGGAVGAVDRRSPRR